MIDLTAGTLFVISLNLALGLAGLFLLRRREDRLPGLALTLGAILSTAIVGAAATTLAKTLFQTRLIEVDLYQIFYVRSYLLFDLAIIVVVLAGWRLLNGGLGWMVTLVGLGLISILWLAVNPSGQAQLAPDPILIAAVIGFATTQVVSRYRWLASVPLALSFLVVGWLMLTTARRTVEDRLNDTYLGEVLTSFQGTQAKVSVPPGFEANVFAELSEPPTAMTVDTSGALYVTTLYGKVIKLVDTDQDGKADQQTTFADLKSKSLGIVWYKGQVFISTADIVENDTGRVVVASDSDGDDRADRLHDILTGLPSRSFHQNDGLAIGPDGRLYIGIGATSDHSEETTPYAATITSVNLDGSDMRVFATGVRNPYGLAFSPEGQLFATDNAPNDLDNALLYVSPDELNLIVEGGDYGFPRYFGMAPSDSKTISPVALFTMRSVPTGLTVYSGSQFPAEYRDNVFVALWQKGGAPMTSGTPRYGQRIARIILKQNGTGWEAVDYDFVTGLVGPIDVKVGVKGELYVADMLGNKVYRVRYVGT